MEYIKNTTEFEYFHTVVSLGKFDGVHVGHRVLLDYMRSLKKEGKTSVVFTFSVNPESYFSKKGIQVLYTGEEKRYIMEELGVDVMISYPFTEHMANMSAESFIRDILIGKLHAKAITAGRGFHFGHGRQGDGALLESLASQYGCKTKLYDKLFLDGKAVSSSRIRKALSEGKIEKANRMLGQPYFISGEVLHGRALGRTLGMPTINLIPPKEKLLPPNGVYTSRVLVDGRKYQGITNIGYNPTVGEKEHKIAETYLYDFEGDLYGKMVRVELFEFVRGEEKYASLEELKVQMHKDMDYGRVRPGRGEGESGK